MVDQGGGQLAPVLTPGLLPEKFEPLLFGQSLLDVVMNSADENEIVRRSSAAFLPLYSHVLHSSALKQIGHRRRISERIIGPTALHSHIS